MALTLNRERSAVLIEDFQNEIVGTYAANAPDLLRRAAAVLESARTASIPVIYVVMEFRDGYPEVLPRLRPKYEGRLRHGSNGSKIHVSVAPKPGEVVITKRRTGPFSTSDLDAVLRAQGVSTLLVMGIITSGCVLSTVRWAADIDYQVIVVADACHDSDQEVHQMLIQKVFPRQATITTSGELVAALS